MSRFKYKKSGRRKRKDNENIPETSPRAKKPRMEHVDLEYTVVTGLGDWLLRMEEICPRAGRLKNIWRQTI